MFHSDDLRDELQALQGDVARLLSTTGEAVFEASKSHAETLVDQVKAALNDLGDTLRQEEGHAEKLIQERPIAALAATFALGVLVGCMLRRH